VPPAPPFPEAIYMRKACGIVWCHVGGADEAAEAMAGGAYVNMMMDEGEERVRASYRDNYDRLARVKDAYDPRNLFRVNQNIVPRSTRQ
jgi:FAD/FMN-containing dehydrogenase